MKSTGKPPPSDRKPTGLDAIDDVLDQARLERLYGIGCFSGEMLAELRLKLLRERTRS